MMKNVLLALAISVSPIAVHANENCRFASDVMMATLKEVMEGTRTSRIIAMIEEEGPHPSNSAQANFLSELLLSMEANPHGYQMDQSIYDFDAEDRPLIREMMIAMAERKAKALYDECISDGGF